MLLDQILGTTLGQQVAMVTEIVLNLTEILKRSIHKEGNDQLAHS